MDDKWKSYRIISCTLSEPRSGVWGSAVRSRAQKWKKIACSLSPGWAQPGLLPLVAHLLGLGLILETLFSPRYCHDGFWEADEDQTNLVRGHRHERGKNPPRRRVRAEAKYLYKPLFINHLNKHPSFSLICGVQEYVESMARAHSNSIQQG